MAAAKSTSGGIIAISTHAIKTYSRQQKTVALSSAEAELYAMVAASAESLAVMAYSRDLGVKLEGGSTPTPAPRWASHNGPA